MMSWVTVITNPLPFFWLWKWEPQNGCHTRQLAQLWGQNQEILLRIFAGKNTWLTLSWYVQTREYFDSAPIVPNLLHQLHISLPSWDICWPGNINKNRWQEMFLILQDPIPDMGISAIPQGQACRSKVVPMPNFSFPKKKYRTRPHNMVNSFPYQPTLHWIPQTTHRPSHTPW